MIFVIIIIRRTQCIILVYILIIRIGRAVTCCGTIGRYRSISLRVIVIFITGDDVGFICIIIRSCIKVEIICGRVSGKFFKCSLSECTGSNSFLQGINIRCKELFFIRIIVCITRGWAQTIITHVLVLARRWIVVKCIGYFQPVRNPAPHSCIYIRRSGGGGKPVFPTALSVI